MNETSRGLILTIALAGLAAAILLPVGCEKTSGLAGLQISPDYVLLEDPDAPPVTFDVISSTGNSNMPMSVSQLALPIHWQVTDPSLGQITRSSGTSALYQRTRKTGKNTIIAKDQYDNEGFAVVEQSVSQYALTLTASPSSVIPAGSNTVTIVATGGEAPYRWWARDSGLGTIISGANSDKAVYQSKGAGVNVVHCQDAGGVLGTISITQK